MDSRRFRNTLLIVLVACLPLAAMSQMSFHVTKEKQSNNGFYFGVNMGGYKANRYTAQYYDGSQGYSSFSANNSYPENIVQETIIDNTINHSAIVQYLNVPDFTLSELPTNMKYSIAVMLGIYLKYQINNSGIFMQFNFEKLTAKDVFTINYYAPFSQNDTIVEEPIWGTEQRFNIDIGYSYTFSPESDIRTYIEGGFNLNNTKFLNNYISIGSLQYSIEDPWASYFNYNRGGIGIGGFAGAGLELVFNNKVSLDPGFDVYYIKTKIGYNDPSRNNVNAYFSKFTLNYSAFVRVILKGIF